MFVKICGITNEEDALLAVAMGADALGFNFSPGSPRLVTPELARAVVRRLPHGVVTVGVFRDERPERVVDVVNRCGLTGAQLHGREPRSEVVYVRKRVQFVIQAFAAGDPALAQAGRGPADVVLLDGVAPGSGRVFDWSLAAEVPDGVRLMLAGGLTPANVGDAVRQVRPWGVDVASGVESEPGCKDALLLQRFVDAARRAAEEVEAAEEGDRPPHEGSPPFDWSVD